MYAIKTLLIIAIFCLNSNAWSQGSAVEELEKLHEAHKNTADAATADLKRLEDEKNRLVKRLSETSQEINVISKKLEPSEIAAAVSIDEISAYMKNRDMKMKRFGRCQVTEGENAGEFFIERDGVKIRFLFLAKKDSLDPKVTLIKDDDGQSLLQVYQPEYDSQMIPNKVSTVTATMRFSYSPGEVGDVVHAVFTGNRVEDKMFGYRSSNDLKTIACDL